MSGENDEPQSGGFSYEDDGDWVSQKSAAKSDITHALDGYDYAIKIVAVAELLAKWLTRAYKEDYKQRVVDDDE